MRLARAPRPKTQCSCFLPGIYRQTPERSWKGAVRKTDYAKSRNPARRQFVLWKSASKSTRVPKSKGSIAKGELGSLRSLGYSPTMRLLAFLCGAALLAGCGGGDRPARHRVEQAVKRCADKQCSEAEGRRLPGDFLAACKEAPSFVLHTPRGKVVPCKRPERSRSASPAHGHEVKRRVREQRPTFTGPNGNTLPPAQAAAAARRLEAQCRKEHAPCTALGGVQLRTQRYKVQIK